MKGKGKCEEDGGGNKKQHMTAYIDAMGSVDNSAIVNVGHIVVVGDEPGKFVSKELANSSATATSSQMALASVFKHNNQQGWLVYAICPTNVRE